VDLIHGLLRGRGGNQSSVDLVAASLWARRSRVKSRWGQEIFLLSTTFILALGPTQPMQFTH